MAFGAAAFLGELTGVEGVADVHFLEEALDEEEHAVALIGIERHEGDLGRFGAADDGLFVFAPEGDACFGVAAAFHPVVDRVGDARGLAIERCENVVGVFEGEVG